ncbi:hypothetical protein ACFQE1_14990, partial [Halobium palmae]
DRPVARASPARFAAPPGRPAEALVHAGNIDGRELLPVGDRGTEGSVPTEAGNRGTITLFSIGLEASPYD